MKSFRNAGVVLMLTVTLIISGCAGFTNWVNNNQASLQLAVDIAVGALMKQHPEESTVVGKVAQGIVTAVASSKTVTLKDLNTYLVSQINLPGLTAIDKKTLVDLAAALEAPLESYFSQQKIEDEAQQLVAVSQVAQMVLDVLNTPAMAKKIQKARLKAGLRV